MLQSIIEKSNYVRELSCELNRVIEAGNIDKAEIVLDEMKKVIDYCHNETMQLLNNYKNEKILSQLS